MKAYEYLNLTCEIIPQAKEKATLGNPEKVSFDGVTVEVQHDSNVRDIIDLIGCKLAMKKLQTQIHELKYGVTT